jgi:hypothetical protein
MKVWRLCRQPFVATALDGIGGLYAGGRWHCRGQPIVYAASSAALAALEVLVHVDPLDAPEDLRLLTLELPDDFPIERNLLLNPLHPAITQVRIAGDEAFTFDPRLLGA